MKKRLFLLTLVATSLLMVGCDNDINSSNSSSNSSEIINEVQVSSIDITNVDTTLKVGEVLNLNVNVLPSNAVNKVVNYESNDSSVASVDFNGVVTARKVGNCVIKAISDDNEAIFDEIKIVVEDNLYTNLNIEFGSDVETVTSTNNTFYKLIIGNSYPLNVSVTPTGESIPELEAEFNLDNYCSFDSKTNTLTPLKTNDNIKVTFKIKGTMIKKEFNLRIINKGEKDRNEVINKLNESIKLEKQKTISHYEIGFEWNVVDLNLENRTHTIENTSFDIYKNGGNYFMLGDAYSTVSKNGETKTTNFTTFKGMDSDYYYEYQVDDNGNHLTSALRKSIASSDSSVTISTASAIKKSTIFTMNSHDGLSEIAKFQLNYLYENSILSGSIPMYFGGNAINNVEIKEENNVISVDTYFVEKKPSVAADEKGEVYFNHGEYTFNNENILTSLSVTSKVYNNDSYDFVNNKLKENPEILKLYKVTYSQEFGEYKTGLKETYNPNNLYFTDYTPIFLDNNKNKVTEYEVGKTYNLSFENPTPNMATNYIDGLRIEDNFSPDVVSLSSDKTSITINKSGVATLGIYSTKNNIKKEITIQVGKVEAEEVKIFIDNKEVTGTIEAKVNQKIDNISFKVNPLGASQEVDVSLASGEGILTPNSNGTYSFISSKEGQSTLFAKAKGTNVSNSIIFNVTKEKEADTLIEKMMAKEYICEEMVTNDYDNSLKITSSTTAVFIVNDDIDYIVNCNIEINEAKKTIKFTSFNPVGMDYDEYCLAYLPVIKNDVEYQISDDCSFSTYLLLIERDGYVSDFLSEKEELTLYSFSNN